MQESNYYSQQRIALDERLLSTLQKIGIIETKAEFSRMCGKNDSYYSCMKAKGYGIHLGTLVFLTVKLVHELKNEQDIRRRARLRSAIEAISTNVQGKCKLRKLELFGS